MQTYLIFDEQTNIAFAQSAAKSIDSTRMIHATQLPRQCGYTQIDLSIYYDCSATVRW